jgi:hypothetical protein
VFKAEGKNKLGEGNTHFDVNKNILQVSSVKKNKTLNVN